MFSDAQLNACFSPTADENGDICNGRSGTISVGSNIWMVQLMYSKWDDMNTNGSSTCIPPPANPLPSLMPFTPVYHQGDLGNGIGGFDLKSPADLAFAFDYDGSGKMDHLALYRPGTGTIWILKNVAGNFSPVYHQGDPGNGIGGYDLKSPADRAFAFDNNGSGKMDHLALYRPGTGTIWILSH
jgi:hypothetical protein